MKILKLISFCLFSTLFIGSCSENKTTNKDVIEQIAKKTTGKLPEMSVYHLTSSWTNQNSEKIQLKALRGKIVVAVMIYTSCAAACPVLVEKVKSISRKMPSDDNKQIQYVFISIDPKTDTPERMKAFAKDKEMDSDQYLFLRSSIDNTRTLSAVLGVNFKQVSEMNYEHSNIISVLDQNGEIFYQQKGLDVDINNVLEALKKLVVK